MSTRTAPITFALASLTPAALILLACILGGGWAYLALVSITLLVIMLDRLPVSALASDGEGNWLAGVVGIAHFAVLWATLWVVGTRAHLSNAELASLLLTSGLFLGQVSNACAHELIHRQGRFARGLGTAIYCSILNGQHVSAHLLVHHVHAGTAKDPNSAPLGRGFYRYMLRASIAEFRAGWRAESRRQKPERLHPYWLYLGGGLASALIAFELSGGIGVAALIGLSLHAQMQLLLSDYLQHYGLQRKTLSDGRTEPMGPHHSWNAPQSYSAALMLNAPLHSDHHMHPGRRFPDLRHDPTQMPTLPFSVPVMGAFALVPPLWRRMMDPRARTWAEVHGNVMPGGPEATGSEPSGLTR